MTSATDNGRYPAGYNPNNPQPVGRSMGRSNLRGVRNALREMRAAYPHLCDVIVDPDGDHWPQPASEPWHFYQWGIYAADVSLEFATLPPSHRILTLRRENPHALERILLRHRNAHEAELRADGDPDPYSPINEMLAQIRRITTGAEL